MHQRHGAIGFVNWFCNRFQLKKRKTKIIKGKKTKKNKNKNANANIISPQTIWQEEVEKKNDIWRDRIKSLNSNKHRQFRFFFSSRFSNCSDALFMRFYWRLWFSPLRLDATMILWWCSRLFLSFFLSFLGMEIEISLKYFVSPFPMLSQAKQLKKKK